MKEIHMNDVCKVPYLNQFSLTLIVIFGCQMATLSSGTNAQGPPLEVVVPAATQGVQTKLEFRYIPAGKISKIPPHQLRNEPAAAEGGLLASPGDYEVIPFYMSKTELTFEQLRAVLKESDLKVIRERIQRTTGRDASTEYLRSAIDQNDYPAFAINVGEAVMVCQLLTEVVNAQQGNGPLSIESRQIRLPSHFEWQYACRAITNANDKSLPHFNRWVDMDALDKQTREMLKEEWETAGRNINDLTGTQLQVLDLIDIRLGSKDAGGVSEKILSAYFKVCLGRDRSLRSALTPVAKGKPNAWELFDMHDNVCEWALVANSREELNALWSSLQGSMPSSSTKECLLLVGGGFSQGVAQKGAWKSFSIWGGYPADPRTGDPVPMKLADGLDTTDRGQAVEMNAGVRLVLDRKLLPDWFVIVRKAALDQEADGVAESFQRFRTTVAEIVPAQDSPRLSAVLDTYQAIAERRLSPDKADPRRLAGALSALGESKLAASPRKSRLSQLVAGSNGASPPAAPPENSENDVFFAAAKRVFETSSGP